MIPDHITKMQIKFFKPANDLLDVPNHSATDRTNKNYTILYNKNNRLFNIRRTVYVPKFENSNRAEM